MEKQHTYLFIGAGSMAEAMIAGMLNSGLFQKEQIFVTNRSNRAKLEYFKNYYGVEGSHDVKDWLPTADVIILAMKPKDVATALKNIQPMLSQDQLLISVIAGVSTESMEQLLGLPIPIIRAMPNTSATIRQSATAIAKGTYADEDHEKIANTLFSTIGTVSNVLEKDLHAVTGISGSGPAYIYYMVEAMEKAATDLGLPKEMSKELILQTIIGAAEMMKTSPKSPATLRKEVTSPGGTTEAGLQMLEQYRYQQAVIECIKSAASRSKELGIEIEKMMEKER